MDRMNPVIEEIVLLISAKDKFTPSSNSNENLDNF